MTESQQSMLETLKGLQGKEFNDRYHADQVTAHKDAVDLFKRYGGKGDQAALKTWASNTLPALQHHLEMAQQLNK
jgi:putative membrane protein